MLEVEGLGKRYLYGAHALAGVSFRVEKGRTLAVLAETEGGKTSLLHCLAGLSEYEGNIRVEGRELKEIPPAERGVRMIHADGGLIKGSVMRNFTYPLKLVGLKREERRACAYRLLEEKGLGRLIQERTRYLYPDDVLRLAFARIELTPCRLLLLDNPFALAPTGEREDLFRELSCAMRGGEHATVFATDSLDEALSADEILILHYGRVAGKGSAVELFDAPPTLYAARFCYPFANLTRTEEGAALLWGGAACEGERTPEGVFYRDGVYYYRIDGAYYRARTRFDRVGAGERTTALKYNAEEKLCEKICASPKDVL